jgi:hypothetical protein
MSISLVGSSQTSSDSNTTSYTASHTFDGTEDYVVVMFENDGDPSDPSSVTVDGVSMTKFDSDSIDDSYYGFNISCWYALASSLPGSGSYNVVANYGSSRRFCTIIVVGLSGCKQQAPEHSTTAGDTSADTSLNITTVVATAGAFTISCVCGWTGQTINFPPSGATHLEDDNDIGPGYMEFGASYKANQSAGNVTYAWVWDSVSDQLAAAFAIAPSEGATMLSLIRQSFMRG